MYDAQLGNIMNQQFNVDQVQFASESIQGTIETVSNSSHIYLYPHFNHQLFTLLDGRS